MTRLLQLGLATVLCAMLATLLPAAPASPRPNVILILADDLALGDLARVNGGRTRTPHLDSLAAGGVWFHAAYSASAVCAPARAALLTGRFPQRTGVVSLDLNREPALTRLHRDEVTIADVFRANGYATGLIGKWHTGSSGDYHPRQRGFAEFEGFLGSDDLTYFTYTLDVQGTRQVVTDKYLTDDLSERAVAFVRRHRGEPFFLHLAHYAPHRPLGAPAAAIEPYLRQGYDRNTATIHAMIEIMDRGIGTLVAELEQLGLRDNTLIVFTSDNGPDPIPGPRFNLGLRGAKYEIHEGGLRVPLVFNWPAGIAAGERGAVAHFTDLFPTLVELAKLRPHPATKPLDGVSLVPVLAGRSDRIDRARFWQWNRGTPNYTHNAAMREGEWKLVRPFVTRNAITGDGAQPPALYNLRTDPLEQTDVSRQHPAQYARMQAALADWSSEVERDRTRTDDGSRP